MGESYWRTYKGYQAKQVWSGLQILIEEKLVSSDEEKLAKSIQAKLRNAMQKEGEGYTTVPFTGKEDEFLTRVEASLWK
jgi:hypothetical protein